MPKLHKITLPSGASVTYREMSALDGRLLRGAFPAGKLSDVASVAEAEKAVEDPKVREESLDLIFRTICLLTVKPRYWCDLRPLTEQENDPRDPPPGRERLELDLDDCVELFNAITAEEAASIESTAPLSETASRS